MVECGLSNGRHDKVCMCKIAPGKTMRSHKEREEDGLGDPCNSPVRNQGAGTGLVAVGMKGARQTALSR